MTRISYEELKARFDELTKSGEDEYVVLQLDASEYVEFNCAADGYLGLNDEEYLDAFAAYADCNYIEVWDIEEHPVQGWGIIISEPYPFAMPIDGEIECETYDWRA